MPVVTSYRNGTPSWVDIGTSDLEGAIAFYSGLFGWQVEIGDPEMGRYSMAMLQGQPVSGLADQQSPDLPIFWTTYLSVDDVDATMAKVEPAGGSVVVPPMDVADFGRFGVATDSGGAHISFWQARQHIGAGLVNEPGALTWNELTTRAVEESIAFYGAVVDWKAKKVDAGGMDYYEWHLDGTAVGGMMPMVGDMWPADLPNHWMVYFAVDDTDATAARCTELGGSTSVPPTDIPVGRFAVLNDPQGAVFSIIKMAPPPA